MAGLLTVAEMIGRIGVAAKMAATDIREATEQIKQDVASVGGTSSSSMGKSGDGSGGGKSMGADQAGAAVGTNSLGAALQMTRGRL